MRKPLPLSEPEVASHVNEVIPQKESVVSHARSRGLILRRTGTFLLNTSRRFAHRTSIAPSVVDLGAARTKGRQTDTRRVRVYSSLACPMRRGKRTCDT